MQSGGGAEVRLQSASSGSAEFVKVSSKFTGVVLFSPVLESLQCLFQTGGCDSNCSSSVGYQQFHCLFNKTQWPHAKAKVHLERHAGP